MCHEHSYNLLKYHFDICLCSMLISLSNVSNLLQNGQFSIFSLFWRHFATIATVKVKLIPEFYTLAIALINYLQETTEKQLLFFDLKGGQNSLLMHVPL